MSTIPKHTLHLQELVQLHVHDMGAFFPIVLLISRKEKGKLYDNSYQLNPNIDDL